MKVVGLHDFSFSFWGDSQVPAVRFRGSMAV